MRSDILELLRCPQTGQRLLVSEAIVNGEDIESGWLLSEDKKHRYPIRAFIPRFVPATNYAANFGMQWNRFRQTQLDSFTGHHISAERFWMATGWSPNDLRGQWVLDLGCGAGRFAEIALNAGAKVVALDYSSAVDACYSNLNHHSGLHVVQGDVYALPFAMESFSYVYSLGVLQHTPDVAGAIAALPPMVAPEGQLCVDFYEKTWKSWFLPKYWLRPITKRMPKQLLFEILQRVVPVLLPLSIAVGKVPVLGRMMRRAVPVANYQGELPLNDRQLHEWALCDTFDWLAPEYDNPQSASAVKAALEKAQLKSIEILKVGHLVGRGTKQRSNR